MDPKAIEDTSRLMRKARKILAYGGFDGIVQRPLLYEEDRVFPLFAAGGKGCELFDTTGQSFIDWVIGWGPVMLGYRRPEVEKAIQAQFCAGPTLSLMHPIEAQVASMLCEMVPCAEMVAFGKNGSDVLTAAVRLARDVTKGKIILQYGMHGFHDWYICSLPHTRGIPESLKPLIHSFPYNNLKALKELFKKFKGEVACVVMEPVREIMPDPDYLNQVKELTHKNGALLIYDEVITAFRLANGGAQEHFGVIPDIACLGKSMANGMPLSAIVGKREYMQYLPAVGFGMTFRGETLSLAAAQAVLKILENEPVAERLAEIGNAVREGFHKACAKHGVRCQLTGPPARMTFVFQDDGGLTYKNIRSLFLQECLKRGIFTNGNILPSYAHDEESIQRTIEGFDAALRVVTEAVKAESYQEERPLGGAPFAPRAMISSGFIEELREENDELIVSGWMLLEDQAPDSILFLGQRKSEFKAKMIKRPDILKAFPNFKNAKKSGYGAILPIKDFMNNQDLELTICGMRKGAIAFQCKVVKRRMDSEPKRLQGPFSTSDGVLYL